MELKVKFSNHFDTNEECQFFVLCNREIVNNPEHIDSLLNATYQSTTTTTNNHDRHDVVGDADNQNGRGYLVLIPTSNSRRRIEDLSNMVSMRLSFATKCTIAH